MPLRLAFLVNRDVESNVALNLLLPALGDRTGAVFLSERVGGRRAGVARMLGQLGFVEQDLFNELVFPLAERDGETTGRYLTFGEIERVRGIPVRSLAGAKDPESLAALAASGADLFISIRFGHILGAATIAIPRVGVLNLHSGLLPQYRGVLATFRALQNGDAEIGCTLHWIDSPGIDVGGIVATARMPVDPARSLLQHILALYPLGARLVLDAVRRIEAGDRPAGTAQTGGSYYGFPTDNDLVRFTAAGWRLFDRDDLGELIARYRPGGQGAFRI